PQVHPAQHRQDDRQRRGAQKAPEGRAAVPGLHAQTQGSQFGLQMSRQLIITSDDFGLSSGVNSAVEKAWQEGILTNASIMPGGNAFDEAVEIARRNPGLQVGLHLTLVQGKAVLSPSEIPGLVDASGNFRDNPVTAGMC